MKAIKKLLNTTPKLIGAAVVLVLLLLWVVLLINDRTAALDLLPAIGWSLVVLVLAWVGIHYGVKAWRKRKRTDLDEAIAAKEGIADRRREWNDWVEELEKRDIDRYELPFYLLVGEPQSGKSVLLHNSDLHFPFGQNRLSGVGGTRGCDWWFTEEAVILDLAGRLFTHEGGASDRLEFDAFLDLLHEFRPLCPANGVILVVPCDSLLKDSTEAAQAKAVKIQNALAALCSKLQAQLPVYLVLTKGDQIFGFAESVHRLDVEHRHQMFGWSRPATKIDAPFDTKEALQGFDSLVARSRLLRGHMLAGARLPEALPEVDRMFAFPHELAGLRANLETYLARVFTESSATERVFFRGLYLTSGLQSGVPIAKVCTELYGQTGEADKRDLEALFSKPKAYFIKDLVRTRIFGERGLVRPTQGRVKNTRRTSAIAYGIAGTFVLVSLLFGSVYLLSGTGKGALAERQAALALARKSAEASPPDVQQILTALGELNALIESPVDPLEDAFEGAKEQFQRLYRSLFDERLAPELQRLAAAETQRRFNVDSFENHADLLRSVRAALVLAQGVDLARAEDAEHLIGGLPSPLRDGVTLAGERALTVSQAVAVRSELGETERLQLAASLDTQTAALLADRAIGALQTCTEPGDVVQPTGALGFVVAWVGVAGALAAFEREQLGEEDTRVLMRRLGRARQAMDTIYESELGGQSSVPLITISNQAKALLDLRSDLAKVVLDLTGTPTTRPPWVNMERALKLAIRVSEKNELATLEAWDLTSPSSGDIALTLTGLISELGANAAAKLPIEEPGNVFDSVTDAVSYFRLAERPVPLFTEPKSLFELALCLREIEAILGRMTPATANKRRVLYIEQCTAAAEEFLKDFATASAVQRALGLPDDMPAGDLSSVFVSELAQLHVVLTGLVVDREDVSDNAKSTIKRWLGAIERHLFDHLHPVTSVESHLNKDTSSGSFDEETWLLLRALATVAELVVQNVDQFPVDKDGVRLLGELYFGSTRAHHAKWASRTKERVASTNEVVNEFWSLCTRTRTELGGFDVLKTCDGYAEFAGAMDRLLADHLEAAVAAVNSEWSAELGTTGVVQAARDALAILQSVKTRIENSEAKGLARMRDLVAKFAPSEPIRQFLPELPLTTPQIAELEGCSLPVLATLTSDPRYTGLSNALTRIGTLVQSDANYGTALAELYRRDLRGTPLEQPGATKNCGLRLVAETRSAFARILADEVRNDYLKQLEEVMTGRQYDVLFDVLLPPPSTGSPFPAEVNDVELRDQLSDFIDSNHTFDTIRKRYLLIGPDSIATDLFPDGSELEGGWTAVHVFLHRLQSFLLGLDLPNQSLKRIEEAHFNFELAPVPESGSIWELDPTASEMRHKFFFPADGPDKGLQSCSMSEFSRRELKVRDWGFINLGADRALRLVWSNATLGKDAVIDPDRYHVTIPSSLAPLLLAWAGDQQDEVGREFRVRLEPQRSQRFARIDVKFDHSIPVRPDRP